MDPVERFRQEDAAREAAARSLLLSGTAMIAVAIVLVVVGFVLGGGKWLIPGVIATLVAIKLGVARVMDGMAAYAAVRANRIR